MRALYGLGLTYLQHNQEEKARAVFEELVVLDGFARSEYKHLFNQFGIELRKRSMIEESIRYYSRAMRIVPDGRICIWIGPGPFFRARGWEKRREQAPWTIV